MGAVEAGLAARRNYDPETAWLLRGGIPDADIEAARHLAALNGTDIIAEIAVLDPGHERLIYAALAREVGLRFISDIDPARLLIDGSDPASIAGALPFAPYAADGGGTVMLLAPAHGLVGELRRRGHFAFKDAQRTSIAAPRALQSAIISRTRRARLDAAVNTLSTQNPDESARQTFTGWQGWFIGLFVAAWPSAFLLDPAGALLLQHAVMSLFFLSCISLRAWATFADPRHPPQALAPVDPAALPRYAVLVALYREAGMAGQLLAAMDALIWPRSKLDVFLVCEEDDRETIDALIKAGLPHWCRIVEVPPGGPRTKPKALMYALPLVSAECTVLYDAEDRPHPEQLLEAWQALSADPALACVQAPLEIANRDGPLIARLFAFEYAALFRALLPALARHRLYVPLGGTSNHFVTRKLVEAGGWDPFNVTEDADIGLRLHVHGHFAGTISRPTLEDAPDSLDVWVKQRTRWFKGFMQTWLVSTRHPMRLWRRIGAASFVIVQVLLGGMVLSALAHPYVLVMLFSLVALATLGLAPPEIAGPLALIDWLNLLLGYAAFIVLGRHALKPAEQPGSWRLCAAIPLYWLAQSWAAWRALGQIVRTPHLWEKTPHAPSRDASAAGS